MLHKKLPSLGNPNDDAKDAMTLHKEMYRINFINNLFFISGKITTDSNTLPLQAIDKAEKEINAISRSFILVTFSPWYSDTGSNVSTNLIGFEYLNRIYIGIK